MLFYIVQVFSFHCYSLSLQSK